MKKTYFAFVKKSIKNRTYWFSKITLSIYQKENLEKIGEVEFNSNQTPWDVDEVYQFLIDKNIIPKNAFDFSRDARTGGGYYRENNPFCTIIILI